MYQARPAPLLPVMHPDERGDYWTREEQEAGPRALVIGLAFALLFLLAVVALVVGIVAAFR